MLANLWLLAQLVGKVAWMTGVGPGILFIYAAEMLVRADRVPTRKLLERWLVYAKQKCEGEQNHLAARARAA